MGKKPAQIEQDIRAQRDHISRRIEGLQHRVQDDMASVRSEAKERASHAMGDARGKFGGAKDSVNTDTLKSLMEDHAITTMAGALGIGVLLGVMSEGFGRGNGSYHGAMDSRFTSDAAYRREFAGRRESSNGSGAIGAMLASVFAPAANTAQEELQQLIREGFGTLKDQVSKARDTTPKEPEAVGH